MAETRACEIIYNGACPVCRAGVAAVRDDGGQHGGDADYADIVAEPDALSRYGLTARDVQYRLHARMTDGTVIRGAAAAAALLRTSRRWRWAGHSLDFPVFRPIAFLGYEALARLLFRWNKRRGHF